MTLEHLGLGGDHLELPHPVGPDLGDVDRVPAAGERHVVRVVHGAAPRVHHRVVPGQVHGHTLALARSDGRTLALGSQTMRAVITANCP